MKNVIIDMLNKFQDYLCPLQKQTTLMASPVETSMFFQSKVIVEGNTIVQDVQINPDYFRTLIESTISKDPIHLVFTVDVSGSMLSCASESRKSKLVTVVDGMKDCLKNVVVFSEFKTIYVSIVTFDHTSFVVVDKYLLSKDSLAELLTLVDTRVVSANGSTAIEKALLVTEQQIEKVGLKDTSVFFLTDGLNSSKDVIPKMVSDFSKSTNRTKYFGVGIGQSSDYDAKLLSDLFVEIAGYPTASDIQSGIVGKMFQQFTQIFKDVTLKPTLETTTNFDVFTTLTKNLDGSYLVPKFELGQNLLFVFKRKTTSFAKPSLDMNFMYNGSVHTISFCSDPDSTVYPKSFTLGYVQSLDAYDALLRDIASIPAAEKLAKINSFIENLLKFVPPSSLTVKKYFDVLLAEVTTLKTNITGLLTAPSTVGMASLLTSSCSSGAALRGGSNARTASAVAGLVSSTISGPPPPSGITASAPPTAGAGAKDDKFAPFDPALLRLGTTGLTTSTRRV